MNSATLIVDIQSYWHPGTGRGSGFYLDAVTHAGADGLPRLPGRTIKGLLRDALWRAEQWQWPQVAEGTTWTLFGSRGKSRDPNRRDENLSDAGVLRVGDACLPSEVAAYLSGAKAGRALIPSLYREHFSTAIEHATGVAKAHSLRGMQVIVPLTLEAPVSEVPGLSALAGWRDTLEAVLPLINAVGAHRSRGFGRARLSLKEA